MRFPVSNKIAVNASSLKCYVTRHSSDSLVSVTVPRLAEGNFLRAVEVISRGCAPVDPDLAAALENHTRHRKRTRSNNSGRTHKLPQSVSNVPETQLLHG
jgi:hypothetical protein